MAHLADVQAEQLLEVGGLTDEQQVEGPAVSEFHNDDGIAWFGGEELVPGHGQLQGEGQGRADGDLLTLDMPFPTRDMTSSPDPTPGDLTTTQF